MAAGSATLTCAPYSPSFLQHRQSPPAGPSLLRHLPILLPRTWASLPLPPLSALPPSLARLKIPSPHTHSFRGFENRSGRPGRLQTGGQFSRRLVARSGSSSGGGRGEPPTASGEEVFFDGGVHYGDLLTNLVFGLTLVWLPLTLAAVFRALFLRYRFTNLRITVQSGLLGGDRKDFAYDVVKDVKVVPRFIGEWGDMAIELKDGTKVDFKCVPKFREIAKYVEERAAGGQKKGSGPSLLSSSGRGGTPKKGFS